MTAVSADSKNLIKRNHNLKRPCERCKKPGQWIFRRKIFIDKDGKTGPWQMNDLCFVLKLCQNNNCQFILP